MSLEDLTNLLDPNSSVEQIRVQLERFWGENNGEMERGVFIYKRATGMAAYGLVAESGHYIVQICPLTSLEADMVDTMISSLMEERESA